MSTRRSFLIVALIILATVVYSGIMAFRLPDVVPTHWNAHDQVDAYGSKWMTVLLMPAIMVATAALMYALPFISPKKFEVTAFLRTFNYIIVVMMIMMATLQVVIMQATLNQGFPVGRVMLAVIMLFFAILGNVMGKVKRNFWVGVRTPWTLADERVWDRTHRLAARTWTVGGVLGFLLAIFGAPFWFVFALLMLMAFYPVVQSYFIYRQIGGGTTTL